MLSVTLWPYTLHMANEAHNATPLKDGEHSPLELFAQVDVSPKLCHFHTFGSPIHILNSKLQSGTSIPKWKSRACSGISWGHHQITLTW